MKVIGDGDSIEIWSRPWVVGLPNGIPRAAFNPLVVNPILHLLITLKLVSLLSRTVSLTAVTCHGTTVELLRLGSRFSGACRTKLERHFGVQACRPG